MKQFTTQDVVAFGNLNNWERPTRRAWKAFQEFAGFVADDKSGKVKGSFDSAYRTLAIASSDDRNQCNDTDALEALQRAKHSEAVLADCHRSTGEMIVSRDNENKELETWPDASVYNFINSNSKFGYFSIQGQSGRFYAFSVYLQATEGRYRDIGEWSGDNDKSPRQLVLR